MLGQHFAILARFSSPSPRRLSTFPRRPTPRSSCQSPSLPSSNIIYHTLLKAFGTAVSLHHPHMCCLPKSNRPSIHVSDHTCATCPQCCSVTKESPFPCSRHTNRFVRKPPRCPGRNVWEAEVTGFVVFLTVQVIQTLILTFDHIFDRCPGLIKVASLALFVALLSLLSPQGPLPVLLSVNTNSEVQHSL